MKQVSVFLENKSGTLINILNILSGIQLQAISIADTVDYGICRMVCERADEAIDLLRKGGIAASISNVFAVKVKDAPGGAAQIVKLFAEAGVSLAYVYSFLYDGELILAFRPDNEAKAREVLVANNLSCIE